MIDPERISHLFPIIEQHDSPRDIDISFDRFKRQFSEHFEKATEEELYALYCYYYGKTLWFIVAESQEIGTLLNIHSFFNSFLILYSTGIVGYFRHAKTISKEFYHTLNGVSTL